MADDAVGNAHFLQHRYRYFTGIGSGVFFVTVFSSYDQMLCIPDADIQIDIRSAYAVVRTLFSGQDCFNALHELQRFAWSLVHFPVTDNDWFSHSISLFLVNDINTRQAVSFQELQRSAAAGRYVAYLIGIT